MRKRIYLSGPLTSSGDLWGNVETAKAVMVKLMQYGFAPLCPHLTAYVDPLAQIPHADWMAVDLPWVAVSDGVLRLPGASKGADMEVEEALLNGIPVFNSLHELREHFAHERTDDEIRSGWDC